jgi:transcriptional regulator with XRE-family HTH domain
MNHMKRDKPLSELFKQARVEQFAQTLKQARISRGVSFRQLAKDLGITIGPLVQYEKGVILPTKGVLERICKYFNLPFKEMDSLIRKGRLERQLQKLVEKCSYPEIRIILLSLYVSDSPDQSKVALTKTQMAKELEKYSFHYIEKQLLSFVSKYLGLSKTDGAAVAEYLDKKTYQQKILNLSCTIAEWCVLKNPSRLLIGVFELTPPFQVKVHTLPLGDRHV